MKKKSKKKNTKEKKTMYCIVVHWLCLVIQLNSVFDYIQLDIDSFRYIEPSGTIIFPKGKESLN